MFENRRQDQSKEETAAQRRQVLVAEDDEDNRDLLCSFLLRNGYDPIPVSSGLLALDALTRHVPDLILLDVTMPGMNGIDVLRQVRERYSPGELPVIMVSGHSESASVVEALSLGANDYLCKPIEFAVAQARIQSQMNRKQSEKDLRTKTEEYATVVESTSGGLWTWNLETGNIVYSEAWKSILGYGNEALTDSPEEWLSRVHPEDLPAVRGGIDSAISEDRGDRTGFREGQRGGGSRTLSLDVEHRLRHREGGYRWVQARGSLVATGSARRLAGTLTDITERKTRDIETGLPSEVVFAELVSKRLEEFQKKRECPFGIAIVGIDRFSALRESLGGSFARELIHRFASRMKEATVPQAKVARLSADELGMVFETSDSVQATKQIETLHRSLNGSLDINGSRIYVSASAGLVADCGMIDWAIQMIRDGQTALQQARLAGSGTMLTFTTEMRQHARARLELEHDLYEAVAREQFELHYQPKIDLRTGLVIGFEALVRWRHPRRGLVPPLDFIPIAEQTGLILPLGMWILKQACRQTRNWQLKYPAYANLTVAVNISSKQLADAGLVTQVANVLAETGLPATCLGLEVTESVLVSDAPAVASLLNQLRHRQIGLHVDDFGTGYSSLHYLQTLPFDTLKIDKTFVEHLGSKRENTEITRAIIALANQLNLSVISEGIETEEQLSMLRNFGAHIGQGYLFSKPLPAEAAETWLAEGRTCTIRGSDQTTETTAKFNIQDFAFGE